MQNHSRAYRKSRTRTLIQLGGLLDKIGLLSEFNIEMGDDLQHPENFELAATLAGFLKEKVDELSEIDHQQRRAWEVLGQTILIRN